MLTSVYPTLSYTHDEAYAVALNDVTGARASRRTARAAIGIPAVAVAAAMAMAMPAAMAQQSDNAPAKPVQAPAEPAPNPPSAAAPDQVPGSSQASQTGCADEKADDAPDITAAERNDDWSDDRSGAADWMSLDQGEVIVVTSARSEQPLAATAITTELLSRKDVDASGATSLSGVLDGRPGVEIEQGGLRGSSIRMRGFGSDEVLILVDGRRIIGRFNGAVDLERFPAESIEQLEIVKGASSVLYGSEAIGGVVNIITRRPVSPLEARAQVRYGSYRRLNLGTYVGGRHNGWTGRVSAGLQRGDGYDLTPDSPGSTAGDYDKWQASGQASYTRGPVEVTAGVDYAREDLHSLDYYSRSMELADRNNGLLNVSAWLGGTLRLTRAARLRSSVQYARSRDDYDNDFRASDTRDAEERTTERLWVGTAQFDGMLGDDHFVTLGVDGTMDSLDAPRVDRPDKETRYRMAAFANDEWTLWDKPSITLVPGMRLVLDSQFGANVAPKLALRVDPSDRVVVRAGYGGGYRAPDFKELYFRLDIPGAYFVCGNSELSPQKSWSVNLDTELRLHRRLWTSVGVFYNDATDLVIVRQVTDDDIAESAFAESINSCVFGNPMPGTTPALGELGRPVYGYFNVGSAYTRGAEANLRAKPALGPIDGMVVELGYAFTSTRDEDEERPLAGRARHRVSLKVGYEHDIGLQLNLRGTLVGPRPFFDVTVDDEMEPRERYDTDWYMTMNARVAQTVLERFTVFAGINNILDEYDTDFLPISPRVFYAGAAAKY